MYILWTVRIDLLSFVFSEGTRCKGFLCSNDTCLPATVHCNGIKECPDGADEQNCGRCLLLFSANTGRGTKASAFTVLVWAKWYKSVCWYLLLHSQTLSAPVTWSLSARTEPSACFSLWSAMESNTARTVQMRTPSTPAVVRSPHCHTAPSTTSIH